MPTSTPTPRTSVEAAHPPGHGVTVDVTVLLGGGAILRVGVVVRAHLDHRISVHVCACGGWAGQSYTQSLPHCLILKQR